MLNIRTDNEGRIHCPCGAEMKAVVSVHYYKVPLHIEGDNLLTDTDAGEHEDTEIVKLYCFDCEQEISGEELWGWVLRNPFDRPPELALQ